jgi:hypothetical protein
MGKRLRLKQRHTSHEPPNSTYANDTRTGSRLFHASSAACTFCAAASRVNGGTGGRTGSVFMSVLGEAECSLTKASQMSPYTGFSVPPKRACCGHAVPTPLAFSSPPPSARDMTLPLPLLLDTQNTPVPERRRSIVRVTAELGCMLCGRRQGYARGRDLVADRDSMSLGRSVNTSLMRAPVAHSVVSKRRSRSVAAAAIIAPISSGASPSGGCQRLPVGLTERGLAAELDSTRADGDGRAMLEPGG